MSRNNFSSFIKKSVHRTFARLKFLGTLFFIFLMVFWSFGVSYLFSIPKYAHAAVAEGLAATNYITISGINTIKPAGSIVVTTFTLTASAAEEFASVKFTVAAV